MNQEVIGKWALLIGLLIAILAAFATTIISQANILLILFILGLIIGFLNISKKETTSFLIAVIALLAVSGSLSVLATIHIATTDKLIAILSNFIALISAATLVVSIKTVLQVSKK